MTSKKSKYIHILVMFALIIGSSVVFYFNLKNSLISIQIEEYDIVIVGGGLAGLSTAFHLNNYSVLILEKENRLGGRVNTIYINNTPIDLGAISEIPPSFLPFSNNFDVLHETGFFGVYYKNNLTFGDDVIDVVNKLNLTQEQKDEINDFYNKLISIDNLSTISYSIVNSLFQVIHTGEIKYYIPDVQYHAFVRFYPDHYANGTSVVVNEFIKRINASISLNSMVISVEDLGNRVKVKYINNNEIKTVYSKACVVATPGTVAKWLIKVKNDECRHFLDSLSYGSFTSVVFMTLRDAIINISYIITHDPPFNTIFKYRKPSGYDVITVYYTDNGSKFIKNLSDEEVINLTMTEFNKIRIGTLNESTVLFSTVQRWKYGTTIVSPECYDNWSYEKIRPSNRVFLAGDYTNLEWYVPTGTVPAILSGKSTASNVTSFFNQN